ncbi:MAG: amidohydrolase [Oscillospiraceae bacterium]|jgi:imidazolonepropionase-like amidohydrolase|nr:amidohydrolase [Oscillospiraceae bacterium]
MLLKNLRIVPVDAPPIADGWIAFDEKITALGALDSCPADDGVDCAGLSAFPGFVDAHSHLGLFGDAQGAEGDDGNEDTNPSTPQISALDGLNPFDPGFAQAVQAGVTTVCVAPGSANALAGQAVILKTYGQGLTPERILNDCAALKLALGENPKRTYGGKGENPATRMGIAALIREKFTAAGEYLEKRSGDDPPDFDAELAALARVLREGIPVHIHAHRADDILTALRLADAFSLRPVIVHGTQGNLIADALRGVPVLTGPLLADRCKPELAGATPSNPGILHKAGVPVAIITDHPETPQPYLALTAGLAVREGMDWDAALRAITLTPAEILGIADRVGSLTPGKDADIVLFATDNPLTLESKPVRVYGLGSRR